MRANDPLYEIAMTLGGHRKEDVFWAATLTALGRYGSGCPTRAVQTAAPASIQTAVASRP